MVLRGRGDGLEEEAEVKEWLGDRVETVWMHSTPTVRNVRNAVGLGGMTLGTLALLWGVLLTIARPGGMPDALPAVLALGGFGALLVALAPDWMLQLKRRTSRLPRAGRSDLGQQRPRSPRRPPRTRARSAPCPRRAAGSSAASSRRTSRRCSGAASTAVTAIDSAASTTATTARADQSVASHHAPVAASAR